MGVAASGGMGPQFTGLLVWTLWGGQPCKGGPNWGARMLGAGLWPCIAALQTSARGFGVGVG